ncbi:Tn3 family transposase [Nonomuraea sp. NPDC003707]
MDSEADSHWKRWLTSEKGTWSARFREIGTSGAAGGPGKRTSREVDTAPRSDPTILTYAVEEPYRRDIKGIRNLQESRRALAGKIFHGRKGEVYQRYYKGMEDQFGALGLVLNCVTLWNTFYSDKALSALREAGYLFAEEDVARLSPFGRRHINVIGTTPSRCPISALPACGSCATRTSPNGTTERGCEVSGRAGE